MGKEVGVTTGRGRIVNYLNLDKLIEAINITGCNNIIISKCDILEDVKIFKLFYKGVLLKYHSLESMKKDITNYLIMWTQNLNSDRIVFSSSPNAIF